MSEPMPTTKRANYGIDAPGVLLTLALIGMGALAASLLLRFLLEGVNVAVATILFHCLFWPGLTLLGQAGFMLWGSKYGKLRLRDRLLDRIPWRGAETVLDVGFG